MLRSRVKLGYPVFIRFFNYSILERTSFKWHTRFMLPAWLKNGIIDDKNGKTSLLFTILCLTLSSIFYYLIIDKNVLDASPFLMWCPGVAAIDLSPRRKDADDQKSTNKVLALCSFITADILGDFLFDLCIDLWQLCPRWEHAVQASEATAAVFYY